MTNMTNRNPLEEVVCSNLPDVIAASGGRALCQFASKPLPAVRSSLDRKVDSTVRPPAVSNNACVLPTTDLMAKKELTQFKALSFDIIGTLVDYEAGVLAWLRPRLPKDLTDDEILESFARVEKSLHVRSLVP